MIRRVEGLGLDGSTVTAMLGKIEVPLISASYGDSLDIGEQSHMGGQQIDEQTQGTYSVDEGSLKVSSVVYRTLILPNMPLRGGGNVRIPIVIAYIHPDLGEDSDLLESCRLKSWPASIQNTSAPFELDLKFKPKQIFWSDARKTINQLRGEQIGAHGF